MKTLLAPARAGRALGLLGHQARARGHDQRVVGERLAAGEVDRPGLDVDAVDPADHVVDAVVQLRAARAHEVLGAGHAEGDEEEARLVDVAVVLVDDGDLQVTLVEAAAQPVGHQRATGPPAQDDDAVHSASRARLAPFGAPPLGH